MKNVWQCPLQKITIRELSKDLGWGLSNIVGKTAGILA